MIRKYDLQEVRSLPILKEISNGIHFKSFASQVTAVDVFYLIQTAVNFSAEKLILGIEASRYVALRLNGKLFPFLTSSNSSILTCRS